MYPLVRLAKPCNHENPKFPRFFLQTGDDLHFGYIKIASADGIMVHAWCMHGACILQEQQPEVHDGFQKNIPTIFSQRMHEGRGGTSLNLKGREDAGQAGAMGEQTAETRRFSFTSCHSIAASPSKPSNYCKAPVGTPCAIPKACKSGIPNPTQRQKGSSHRNLICVQQNSTEA